MSEGGQGERQESVREGKGKHYLLKVNVSKKWCNSQLCQAVNNVSLSGGLQELIL